LSMPSEGVSGHRATYILEHGTWKARCRTCGWEVEHHMRRQAASLFRYHIKAARSAPTDDETVDLREFVLTGEVGPAPDALPS
jgi:hypothetical protein